MCMPAAAPAALAPAACGGGVGAPLRRAAACGVATALLLGPTAAHAQGGGQAASTDWVEVALGMAGGLVLFLFAVDLLAGALREVGGGRLQRLLERSSSNRVAGLAAGTVATVALDSSSVVIILLIAAVDAALLPFAQALPVILGANIGTTANSQLFAWNVDAYAPVAMATGLLLRAVTRGDKARRIGTILLGLGLVLFALHLIGEAAAPLKEDARVTDALRRLRTPLLGALAGAAVTVAIQSSSALMGIVITLAGGGLIELEAGLAMMLGAEIGTCADTLLATAGRSRAAVKAGIFHLLFNIAGVALGLLLIAPLGAFARWSAEDTGQQVANAHALFNVAGALLMLPFIRWAAAGLERIVPERHDEAPAAT